MIITLLGMSGVGKTYWAKQLEHEGFKRSSADDHIEDWLSHELVPLGYKGLGGVARWMGQPYDDRYARTSQRYLDFEREVMLDLLARLGHYAGTGQNLVVDTTGSVIYLPNNILRALSDRSVMMYFHTPESAHADMARQYLLDRSQLSGVAPTTKPRREPSSSPCEVLPTVAPRPHGSIPTARSYHL